MTRLPGFLATVSFVPLHFPAVGCGPGRSTNDPDAMEEPSAISPDATINRHPRNRIKARSISTAVGYRRSGSASSALWQIRARRARHAQVELADRDVSGLPREPDRGRA